MNHSPFDASHIVIELRGNLLFINDTRISRQDILVYTLSISGTVRLLLNGLGNYSALTDKLDERGNFEITGTYHCPYMQMKDWIRGKIWND